ncbi:hypothetical protein CYMTET_52414 [Cymbomonas tetramitiformis]|uniref:Uncharacterized protein n=1 Tax=Cymbomonas tetramitiformis TaxID=36881 RepID=A0AAE0ERN3_9CHLO|nr:hypothetical protein CYMTET_52414 [Cymbomonas tetramitiformis]
MLECVPGTLKDIKDLEGPSSFPYRVSPPRYGVEAFYIFSIGYYENVPMEYYDQSSTFAPTNEIIAEYKADGTEVEWMNVTPGLDTGGYELGVVSKNLVGMMFAGWFWLFVTFMCMVTFDISKKA